MTRIEHLRTLGVLAHVDAGKTTLTERMLFAAGRIRAIGEVHDGRSAMDSREIERRHGVTVSAAATAFDWKGARVSILDTPGHVDFTVEVERALLAIDSAVVVFSAVAGVEPQTETVWRQADRFGLPRIGFVNKLDAAGADFDAVLTSVAETLGARPAALHWPVTSPEGGVEGIVDLVEELWLVAGCSAARAETPEALVPEALELPESLEAEAARRREALIETLLDALSGAGEDPFVDQALERFLAGDRIRPHEVEELARRACLSGAATPMLAGAAYRGIGVTPLLDAVVALAPSPADRGPREGRAPGDGAAVLRAPAPDAPVSALVSKVAVTRHGPIATARVVSGRVTPGLRLVNATTGAEERVGRVLAVHADETVEIAGAGPGEIVALAGLKSAAAGDTLADPRAPVAFAGFRRPEPVVEAAIEPVGRADQAKLGPALAAMTREDPSLRVSRDAETGELLLAGMGELHLSIALEALAEERGVEARIGPPRIAYREEPTRPAEVVHTLRKQTGGPGQFAKLTLRLEPLGPGETGLAFENRSVGGAVPAEFLPAIEASLTACLEEGPLSGWPVTGLRAVVLDGAAHAQDSSALAFANAARAAFREAYAAAAPRLLEPLGRIEAQAPEAHVGAVIADLQARRGAVLGVEPGARLHRVCAEAPMANLWGYAGAVRSLTRGHGQASVGFARHAPAPQAVAETLIRQA